jgi:hypothetical protein
MANVSAATNARVVENAEGVKVRFLRAMGPFGPESLAGFPRRLTTNRNSAGCSPQPPFEPIYGTEPPTAYQHTYEQGG